MQNELSQTPRILSASYWRLAAEQVTSTKMLVFAALIVALRVVVKLFKIPIAPDIELSLDCYVNSLGSVVYGPVMGLLVGAVSDTLGCILFPSGPYFFPFILTEMSSSFLFALFFWKRRITVPRVLTAKFTVNLLSNIVLTSLIMKWDYYWFYGTEKAYPLVNLVRIVKNLVLFPLEATLISFLFSGILPALVRLKVIPAEQKRILITKKDVALLVIFALLSVGICVFYVQIGAPFLKQHNIKFW